MPQLDRWSAIQLGVLLLAVPAQYIVSSYMSNNVSQRNFALKRIINNVVEMKSRYLTLSEWQKWCLDLLHNIQGSSIEASDDMGESPAIEVLKFRDPEGYFAGSTEPRSPREPHIKFRIGQVIQHKQYGYRGVIVGWDPVAKAPDAWIKQNHPPNKPVWRWQPNYLILVDFRLSTAPLPMYEPQENIEPLDDSHYHQDEYRKGPNYSILVDTRDRLDAQKTYVVEANIEVVANTKIIHPDLEEYFEHFDGAQYLPRPWLKKLYPHD